MTEVRPTNAESNNFRFASVESDLAIDSTYRNGEDGGYHAILESLGGGAGFIDFDRDGWQDLIFPTGGILKVGDVMQGAPSKLFRNLGTKACSDVTGASRMNESLHYSHGCSVADYDNDGFSDILITGYGGLCLWHNQGDGTFTRTTDSSQMNDRLWSTSAAWADFNGDGLLDVYIAHYVTWSFANNLICEAAIPDVRDICPPRSFDPLADVLYINRGDGTFLDGSDAAGLRRDGKGLGVLAADLDLDGDVDIYVANDTTDNFLYLNDGHGNFAEVGTIRGVAVNERGTPDGSMGVDLCDFNQDGQPDVFVANFERETFALYRNDGGGHFLHVSQSTGITALGGLYVGFGAAAADLDLDGDEDFVVANGNVVNHPISSPLRQIPLLLRNDKGWFRKETFTTGQYFGDGHRGRGLAVGDMDNDGDVDLVFTNLNEPTAVLRNDRPDGELWLQVRLVGRSSNRDAVGARLVLTTDRRELHRQIKGGGSYLSHSDSRVHWGLPAGDKIQKLTVHWPSGSKQDVLAIEPRQLLTVTEVDH